MPDTRTSSHTARIPLLSRLIKSSRGQSIVEFGLILPVLLILMLGAIDFGRLFFAYVSVTNAARNGAQYASFNVVQASDTDCGDGTCLRLAAISDTTNLLDTSSSNPDVYTEACSSGSEDDQGNACVRVTVDYTFNTLFPWPGIPNSLDMSRSVQMRVGELP